jgi:hypothetical protein
MASTDPTIGRLRDAAFRPSIMHVVSLRAEEQMVWIHAPWHVATMADTQALRDWSVRQFPSDTIGIDDARAVEHLPTAVRGCGSSPQPAGFGFLDVFPEPFGERSRSVFRSARVATVFRAPDFDRPGIGLTRPAAVATLDHGHCSIISRPSGFLDGETV